MFSYLGRSGGENLCEFRHRLERFFLDHFFAEKAMRVSVLPFL